jgi:starch synthase
MPPLKICFVTSELAPYAKAGGLADVSSALPRALHRDGHDVRVLLPLYGNARIDRDNLQPIDGLRDIEIGLGPHRVRFDVLELRSSARGPITYWIHCPALFGRPALYSDDADEHLRFLLLSRACFETCQRVSFGPDVFHCNDWPTALVPLFRRTLYAWDRLFERSRTLLTIHNLGYQGIFSASVLGHLGLDGSAHLLHQEDLARDRINFLRTGLLYADRLSTVSPTYAREIQSEELGMGLDDTLRARSQDLVGILNGIDPLEWHPRTDTLLPFRYSARSLWRKSRNKELLLRRLGLGFDPSFPALGMVTRLTSQKGLDLLRDPLPELLAATPLRLVVVGSGEARYEEFFTGLHHRFRDQVCFHRGFHNELAHEVEAGCDMFLMPSIYEPCGLNQMYSLTYGTVPIVRRTGGLADTVRPYDPATGQGTGIVFEHADAEGVRWALRTALRLFDEPDAWRRLVHNGMGQDFSWERRAQDYVQLYTELTRADAL